MQHRSNWLRPAAYPVGVERGFITRDDAIKRILTSLRFFWNSPHGSEPDSTGYNPYIISGLRRAGFSGGWLNQGPARRVS